MTFYLGKSAVGIFIPAQLDIGTNSVMTSRFYDGHGNDRGTLSLVGPNNDGEHSGFFLLIRLTKQIKDLMRQRVETFNNERTDREIVELY